MDDKPYADFGVFLKKYFRGKVQKISINAGFTCPNRDGTKGKGGCTYCNNQTFSPEYCHTDKSITEQLQEGIGFFGRKYPDMEYLAYFQAYTNTYGDLRSLQGKYEEALSVHGVVGLIIGTRPDCMSDRWHRIDMRRDVEKNKPGTYFFRFCGCGNAYGKCRSFSRSSHDFGTSGRRSGNDYFSCRKIVSVAIVDIEITSVATDPQYPYGVRAVGES